MGTLSGWTLGWIGIGRMGTPLSLRLLRAGATLWVSDADPARCAPLALEGAQVAPDVAALARQSPVLLTMVPDDAALLAVVRAAAPVLRPGQMLIDLSTISPAASAEVASILAPLGVEYLRCPVSGSTATAEAGALTLFLSGPDAAMARLRPVLSVLGREMLCCGPAEEARATKLMVNLLVALTPAIIGEALAFGGRLGLTRETMLAALSQSVAGSPLLAYKVEMLKARDWTPSADIDLLAKDVDLALEVGRRVGAPMPLSALARQFAAAYQASGEGGMDFFRVATWPERLLAANAP